MSNDELNQLGGIILDASITVHRELGPGLLESAYVLALMHELQLRGLKVRREVPVELVFKGCHLGKCYEIDLLVEENIIVEAKSVIEMHPIYTAQLITHLKLYHRKLGYLINFNVPLLIDGFKRLAYNFY